MQQDQIIPDLKWYTTLSRERGLTPRCPFTSVEMCPRYFLSLRLLKYTGATSMDEKDDARLMKKWKGSNLMPRLAEQEPSVGQAPSEVTGQMKMFMMSHFCPEVMFERYGYFASSVARHADEIDRDFAHASLGREKAGADDWRWSFSDLLPLHYSECPTYSPLAHQAISSDASAGAEQEKGGIARLLSGIKNHWIVSGLVLVAAIVGALDKFTGLVTRLWGWIAGLIP